MQTLGRFAGLGHELVPALLRRQPWRDLSPMQEVAHDAIPIRPVLLILAAMMVRTEGEITRERDSTQRTQAHDWTPLSQGPTAVPTRTATMTPPIPHHNWCSRRPRYSPPSRRTCMPTARASEVPRPKSA